MLFFFLADTALTEGRGADRVAAGVDGSSSSPSALSSRSSAAVSVSLSVGCTR